MKLWSVFAGILLYMEIIYHLGCFGFTACNPIFAFTLIVILASIQTGVVGSLSGKWKKRSFWICNVLNFLLYGVQFVYMQIFKQPLLLEAAYLGGGDALSSYWREALGGIFKSSLFLLLMLTPLIVVGILIYQKKWNLPILHSIEKLRTMLVGGVGIVLAVMTIVIGYYLETDFSEEYLEFYDPLSVIQTMGVLPMAQRDVFHCAEELFSNTWGKTTNRDINKNRTETVAPETQEEVAAEVEQDAETLNQGIAGEPARTIEPEPIDTSPNQLSIDFGQLKAESRNQETTWLAEYMENLTPSNRNEYTGIFEGYNLIYLTAEGFSPYGVREDLTPTLYRLVHSGFVFTNYYTPLWQTSTSDGEYINCTGLIPDGQFSMRKSGSNDMLFTLPRYFAKEGVSSLAYHNNSLSYYDRYKTHNNLGYDFKAARLGDLTAKEWGDKIFPMENPNAWPASDLEMIQNTLPEYIDSNRFHVYYMTVSGHMNYNFQGNAMSAKNKDAVAGLNMSENARAYIACHIELDKGLEYLLDQLEAVGKLENTVICLSTDHYPYGMSQSEYEELAGRSLSGNLEMFRNNLILWNAGMEEEPVEVEKVCGSMDIVPTLLNLFGFEYDSRLYAGRDIFAPGEGMVIFNDRSFITDTVIYNRKAKNPAWRLELSDGTVSGNGIARVEKEGAKIVSGNRAMVHSEKAREEYIEAKKQEVKDRYTFSANILRNNYYKDIMEAIH